MWNGADKIQQSFLSKINITNFKISCILYVSKVLYVMTVKFEKLDFYQDPFKKLHIMYYYCSKTAQNYCRRIAWNIYCTYASYRNCIKKDSMFHYTVYRLKIFISNIITPIIGHEKRKFLRNQNSLASSYKAGIEHERLDRAGIKISTGQTESSALNIICWNFDCINCRFQFIKK